MKLLQFFFIYLIATNLMISSTAFAAATNAPANPPSVGSGGNPPSVGGSTNTSPAGGATSPGRSGTIDNTPGTFAPRNPGDQPTSTQNRNSVNDMPVNDTSSSLSNPNMNPGTTNSGSRPNTGINMDTNRGINTNTGTTNTTNTQ